MKRMLLITAGVLIIAAAFLIWDAALLRDAAQTVRESQSGSENTKTGITAADNTVGGTSVSPVEDVAAEGSEQSQENQENNNIRTIKRSEPVQVTGNTPEYDMRITLVETFDLKTFLRMEYFLNGMGIEYELDEEQLPEIKNILDRTSSQQDDINTNKIQQLLLNPVYGQLYLLVHGGPAGENQQTSFYRIDLADKAVHKLFSYPGQYGRMLFNRDYSMLAYSLEDPPVMSVYQEDKLLEIYDCKNGEYTVRGSMYQNAQPLGINHIEGYLYDYELTAWETQNVVRLKQGVRKMTNLDAEPVVSEVLYDISKNLLMSSSGGEWTIPQDAPEEASGDLNPEDSGIPGSSDNNEQGEGTPNNGKDTTDDPDSNNPAAGDPAAVLKAFYAYLQSEEDYDKAMKLLDDNFKLRMAMLRQFGVDEINKSDIDAQYGQEGVSLYSNLLKAAKLDTIAEETRTDGNTVVIKYYQNLGLSSDSQIRQLMSAKLVLVNKEYKIVLIEDGVQ